MGSYDGAETCELVGNFLLSQLQDLNINVGLYRDDGLAITSGTPKNTENIKKELCRIFNNNGLRITIEANKRVVIFLDVTFDLNRNTYQPFTKPNAPLQYVHRESNHPPTITKNIPASINKRLSTLSSDKETFDQAAPPYQKALDESGYNYTLHYEPNTTSKRKNRQRNNIIWYNPPFSKNKSTNIGHRFLSLIDKHFPKDHKLRKIFNRNTIKISYSCMSNTKQIIDSHNKRIIASSITTEDAPTSLATANDKTCNCRQKNACPLDGNCLQSSVIYQATVTRKDNNTSETYVGLTENEFKTRYRNHTASFRHAKHRNSTELSKYIWKILSSHSAYNSSSKRCNLCLKEKLIIIRQLKLSTLNNRNELVSWSLHRNKALLCNS
ncbi:uncharacterized protein LOC125568422 [Nematostella vectensis]|uniref:uncharacterized protein LOC125568422 n=1 Tax=Nematostella vectensis TaxID=45351 RepID=UPI0020776C7E|nr:uncharacterized protein LOC125568422 [Nematostella vectensis]